MNKSIKQTLLKKYKEHLVKPYNGSLVDWVNNHVVLPNSYAQPGKVDLTTSPYLLQPSLDLLDPKIRQVNLIGAVQTGKSFLGEIWVPYIIVNNPHNILKIHQNDDAAKFFNSTRLAPILENCEATKPFLKRNRFAIKKDSVILPHMNIKCVGGSENYLHGISVRTLIMDEAHLYEPGVINKAIARTNAFAQNRKILICSQPNVANSELHKHYESGQIFEWQFKCSKCNEYQAYRYSEKRNNGSFSGLNWDTVLNSDGETTNIAASAKTAYLECHYCSHKITDTITNRRYLNDTGKYVCIKSDGDPAVRSYTWPAFVNIGLSFEYFAIQGMAAKRTMKSTGLKEDWITFVNQVYGRFYKQEAILEQSKILIEDYKLDDCKDGIKIMTVDVQRKGNIKYYVVRHWNKSGNTSRRLEYGLCRSWEEIDAISKKYNIPFPCVGLDSGDGMTTAEVYQETVKHGKVITLPNKQLHYASWIALKGDQKLNYKHRDGIMRLFSEETQADAQFAHGDKLKGIPVKLYLWSNYSIKTILTKLRDNEMKGIKWLADTRDSEYELHMYSENLVDVIDKKTGIATQRWIQKNEMNHYFDCECMNLAMAIMYNHFSATHVDHELVAKLSKDEVQKQMAANHASSNK